MDDVDEYFAWRREALKVYEDERQETLMKFLPQMDHYRKRTYNKARLSHISYVGQILQLPDDIQDKRQAKDEMNNAKVRLDADGKPVWECPTSCGKCYACSQIKATQQKKGFIRRILNRILKKVKKVAAATDGQRILSTTGQ